VFVVEHDERGGDDLADCWPPLTVTTTAPFTVTT
jgi:hypothetical protein